MNDTSLISIAALAVPLDDDQPSGENLEYDAQFLALEEAVRGKPETQYGNIITPATAPDWKAVRALALALMARTRDLRVAVFLTRGLVGVDGANGLAAGLSLLAALLSGQWQTLHPQLDPDDDFDPTLRLNTLSALVENGGLLRQVRDMPLVEVRAVGAFSLRDIDAAGEEPVGDDGAATVRAVIDAAFSAAHPAQIGATCAALDLAVESVDAIDQALTGYLAAGTGLDLAPLANLLRRASTQLRPHLAPASLAPSEATASGGGAEAAAAPVPAPRQDVIASRADVVRQLDRLCGWYAQQEPSSPVPLLLQRARGLVDKNFTELMQELAPEGLQQLAQVSGVRPES